MPKRLRERISRDAAGRGVTAAALIAELLDERDRLDRFRAVRDAYATAGPGYRGEVADWDSLAGDGLD